MKRIVDPSDDPAAVLASGLRALNLKPGLAPPLLAYLAELVKWNAAYNLTAVRNPVEMVTRHLLDSLAVLPFVFRPHSLREIESSGSRLLDVGSGAGLPGIPLAIAQPQWQVAVLDSNGKKSRFLRHAVRTLGLMNVEVIEARAEQYQPELLFDAVISRAFSALGDFVLGTDHALAPDGLWLAMKGRIDDAELTGLPANTCIHSVVPLQVPGLNEDRHLVVIGRARAFDRS